MCPFVTCNQTFINPIRNVFCLESIFYFRYYIIRNLLPVFFIIASGIRYKYFSHVYLNLLKLNRQKIESIIIIFYDTKV